MKSLSCRDRCLTDKTRMLRLTLPVMLGLAGCADIPPLDGSLSAAAQAAPYPRLLPLDDMAAAPTISDPGMDDRIAALQQRATALRATDPGALQ